MGKGRHDKMNTIKIEYKHIPFGKNFTYKEIEYTKTNFNRGYYYNEIGRKLFRNFKKKTIVKSKDEIFMWYKG